MFTIIRDDGRAVRTNAPDLTFDVDGNFVGILLNCPEMFEEVARYNITDDMFDTDCARKTFSTIRDMMANGLPVTTATVTDVLIKEDRDAMDWACSASLTFTTKHTFEYYVREIKTRAARKKAFAAGVDFAKDAKDTRSDFSKSMSRTEAALAEINEASRTVPGTHDIIMSVLDDLKEQGVGRPPVPATPLPWQAVMNIFGGGLRPGLHVLAGLPSTGKSTFEGTIARHLLKMGKHVARACMDMSVGDMIARDISAMAGVPLSKIRKGSLVPDELKRLEDVRGAMSADKWHLHMIHSRDAGGIATESKIIWGRDGLSLLTVDYLQLLRGDNPKDNDNVRISKAINRLKAFSFDTGVPVLLLSQLNRSFDREQDGRLPRLSDLRDSGSIEQDASTVSFLCLDQKVGRTWCSLTGAQSIKDLTRRPVVWDVAKNQQGALGKVGFVMLSMMFSVEQAVYTGEDSANTDFGYDFTKTKE